MDTEDAESNSPSIKSKKKGKGKSSKKEPPTSNSKGPKDKTTNESSKEVNDAIPNKDEIV